jgi:hypothetical protein
MGRRLTADPFPLLGPEVPGWKPYLWRGRPGLLEANAAIMRERDAVSRGAALRAEALMFRAIERKAGK